MKPSQKSSRRLGRDSKHDRSERCAAIMRPSGQWLECHGRIHTAPLGWHPAATFSWVMPYFMNTLVTYRPVLRDFGMPLERTFSKRCLKPELKTSEENVFCLDRVRSSDIKKSNLLNLRATSARIGALNHFGAGYASSSFYFLSFINGSNSGSRNSFPIFRS